MNIESEFLKIYTSFLTSIMRERIIYFADCSAYERWFQFELAYRLSQGYYQKKPSSQFYALIEEGQHDIRLKDNNDNNRLRVEIKVLYNNKDFYKKISRDNNCVKCDIEKIQKGNHAGYIIVGLNARKYDPEWKEKRLYDSRITMGVMETELKALLMKEGIKLPKAVRLYSGKIPSHCWPLQSLEVNFYLVKVKK